MSGTKEKILLFSLRLFAEKGYEAVSVSDIAEKLGVTKGALYKHYKNKRDIFDSIVLRMEELDLERAKTFDVPENAKSDMPEKYEKTPLSNLIDFSRAQFDYWTKEEFPSCFRKMLTLEQFKNDDMKALYQQYLVSGPLGYVTDIFESACIKDADKRAVELYASMFLFYSLYDGAENKIKVSAAFGEYLDSFSEKLIRGEREHDE